MPFQNGLEAFSIYLGTTTSTLQQVSEMEAFTHLKVAGGDLLEGGGS